MSFICLFIGMFTACSSHESQRLYDRSYLLFDCFSFGIMYTCSTILMLSKAF